MEIVLGRYYDDSNDAAGCLTTLLISGIIISVLIYFAAIVLYYIFIGIVIFAAIVGTVISIKNYVIALKNSVMLHRNDVALPRWKFPLFTYKWYRTVLTSIKEAWKSNIYSLRVSFQQGLYFRFLSIRRWFYWFTGTSVLIFGLLVSVGIAFFHLMLLMSLFVSIATIVVVLAIAIGISGIFVSIFQTIKSCFGYLKAQKKASRTTSIVEYVKKWGYKGAKKMPKLLWKATNEVAIDAKKDFFNNSCLSIKKWLGLGVFSMIYPITFILIPIVFIIQIIIQTVLYLCFLFSK